tara:strand:- start:915 stop:1154 length:240 start_codon:yes stop_codon:yes gene_type:complete
MNDLERFQIMDEVAILRRNVADLQEQLNRAHKRIAELLEPSVESLEEQLVRKIMLSRGLDPSNPEDIKEYWRDYHGIKD